MDHVERVSWNPPETRRTTAGSGKGRTRVEGNGGWREASQPDKDILHREDIRIRSFGWQEGWSEGVVGLVGSIAGIHEQTNQDSQLKNKVLRSPPAVRELPSRYELRVTAGRVAGLFCSVGTGDRVFYVMEYTRTTWRLAKLFALFSKWWKTWIKYSDVKLLINNV